MTKVPLEKCINCIDSILEKNNVYLTWQIIEISELVKEEIDNILIDNCLTNLLIRLKEVGFISYSDNPWNEFEEEKEIKILDVDVDNLTSKLEELWAIKRFDWKIKDVYYDYEDKRLDNWQDIDWNKVKKRSFRVRKKISKNWEISYYYTIKRKKPSTKKSKFRTCYEKEFRIDSKSKFVKIIKDFWIKKVNWRDKNKRRISYYLENWYWDIKFDIDIYEWSLIPPILEIEASTDEVWLKYIRELWLSKHQTLDSGYRWLVKFYKEQKKKKNKN